MRASRGMGAVNPDKMPKGRKILRKDALEPVEIFKEGGSTDKWIQGAIKKPGALHKQLGVPAGKKIPAEKLASAAKKPGKLGQRARFAETLRGMK